MTWLCRNRNSSSARIGMNLDHAINFSSGVVLQALHYNCLFEPSSNFEIDLADNKLEAEVTTGNC